MIPAACVLALLAPLLSASALAQADQSPPLAPQCPAGSAARVDTSDVTVGIVPSTEWKDAKYNEADRQRMRFYADGIRRHFVAPLTLGELPWLAEVDQSDRKGDDGTRSSLGGRLALIVTPAGRVSTAAWESVPISVPLANAITGAATLADSSGDFDGIPRRKNASDTLSLTIRSWRQDAPAGAVALMRTQVIGYMIERPAMLLKRRRPQYPENARKKFVENVAMLEFIVGSNGRAVMSSFQITRIDWNDFEATLRQSVAESTYRPARSGGCTVPQLMSQAFEFRIWP
jgi:hypothetical protein